MKGCRLDHWLKRKKTSKCLAPSKLSDLHDRMLGLGLEAREGCREPWEVQCTQHLVPHWEREENSNPRTPIYWKTSHSFHRGAMRWAHSELFFRLLLKNTVCSPLYVAYASFWRGWYVISPLPLIVLIIYLSFTICISHCTFFWPSICRFSHNVIF